MAAPPLRGQEMSPYAGYVRYVSVRKSNAEPRRCRVLLERKTQRHVSEDVPCRSVLRGEANLSVGLIMGWIYKMVVLLREKNTVLSRKNSW